MQQKYDFEKYIAHVRVNACLNTNGDINTQMKDYYKGYNNFSPNLINTKYLHIHVYMIIVINFKNINLKDFCVFKNEFKCFFRARIVNDISTSNFSVLHVSVKCPTPHLN